MTTYFVTGATGFLGRRLLAKLPGCDTVYALVRPGSQDKLTALVQQWPRGDTVVGVHGDLAGPGLGIDPARLPATVDHVVHLAAVYDFTASADANRAACVTGTRHVLELAERLSSGCLHHVSSVAVAGDHAGRFTERDFDLGQHLPSPYHATKFEAEQLVRQHCRVPWRVYRPAAVVGDSRTGEMDKIDGPYGVRCGSTGRKGWPPGCSARWRRTPLGWGRPPCLRGDAGVCAGGPARCPGDHRWRPVQAP